MATRTIITPQQFRQIATMYDAGLDITQAIENISKDSDLYLQPVVLQLKQGTKLSTALKHSKVITPYETALLETGEQSGKLSGALKQIAAFHESRYSRVNRLKTQLMLPLFVAFIGIAAVTVLDITQGNTALTSVVNNGIFLAVLYAATKWLTFILKSDIFSLLSIGWNLSLHNKSALFQRYFEFHFYTLLTWQINAGVDYQSALRKNAQILSSKNYQAKVRNAQNTLEQGHTILSALQNSGLILSANLRQVVHTGEQSGNLDGALKHHLTEQKTQLEQTTNLFFEWLPRFYYVLVIALVLSRFP